MLLDPTHASLEFADDHVVAAEGWQLITARRSPTICSPNSLRVVRRAAATSAHV
jgi:hypothetical protein